MTNYHADHYYLSFQHNQLQYAVPAIAVQEVFYLPQLNVIPEAPGDIIGSVNLRGEIIPVMNLNLRFGYPPIDYHLTDSIIILNWQELKLGIVANQINEVTSIDAKAIVPELSHDHPFLDLKQNRFLDGFLQQNEILTLLLNLEKLLRYVDDHDLNLDEDLFSLDEFSLDVPADDDADELVLAINAPQTDSPQPPIKHNLFWPHATAQERQVLTTRSDRLRERLRLRDLTGLQPVSVFKLGQEYFGINLPYIREFIDYKQITPIPCTPNFVLGNINFRGEVITIFDLRNLFNLPISLFRQSGQAIVINVEGTVAGILIDEIHDIFMMNPKDLLDAKTVEDDANQSFLQGVLPYQDRILSLIDLTAILEQGGLLIDQAV
ncbi:MAG: chemotaxis protein CheW [Synechocystis sp.]|nr:chemotaxis protein CheW [Synechocystis sp.]